MGKASRWFRGLLGLKKPDSPGPNPDPVPKPPKKRWGFAKSHRHSNSRLQIPEKSQSGGSGMQLGQSDEDVDPNKHAVAEAALAAANAAAAVVRLTSSGRANGSTSGGVGGVSGRGGGYGFREEWAAVVIQSHFRGYLSRRALRALKGLVKLQALVRGHIVRKQTTDALHYVQVLLRAQARARAGWAQISESSYSSAKLPPLCHPGPATPEKFEQFNRARSMKQDESFMLKRNCSKNAKDCNSNNPDRAHSMRGSVDDERSDKILEIDTGKPYVTSKRRNLFHSAHLTLNSDNYSHSHTTSKDSTVHQTIPSSPSFEAQSNNHGDSYFWTAENSPQFHSASSKGCSSRRGPFTPTKSDTSRSCLSGYSDYPSYMAYTESAKAKMRSLSAPRQRLQYERSGSTKRHSVNGLGESRLNPQKVSALQANFTSKAYPGSGRLDRLGMPMGVDGIGFSTGNWNRLQAF